MSLHTPHMCPHTRPICVLTHVPYVSLHVFLCVCLHRAQDDKLEVRPGLSRTVFVGALNFSTTEQQLLRAFGGADQVGVSIACV